MSITATLENTVLQVIAFIPLDSITLARRIFNKRITRIAVASLPGIIGQDPWQVISNYAWDQDFDGEVFLENIKKDIDGVETIVPTGVFVPRGMDPDFTDINGIDPQSIPDPESFEWGSIAYDEWASECWEVAA